MPLKKHIKRHIKNTKHYLRDFLIVCFGIVFIVGGIFTLWVSTFRIPSIDTFEERRVDQSSKIYDSTGTILLYDVFKDSKRTPVSYEKISPFIKQATIAIEDKDFYTHKGIKITSIIRAVIANIFSGGYTQGGSTITQQVVKNSLLTQDKTISRKLKEWVLAYRLDNMLSKDEILSLYLNDNPYGGNVYGVEEASKRFFGKTANDVTLAEAAYLAALPQSPSYYSPYGTHTKELDTRKNTVLREMKSQGFISDEAYKSASNESVTFLPRDTGGIKAPHFVFFVKDYLEKKYGQGILEKGGLKVITTLDYNLELKAEETVKKYALENKEKFDSENASLVAIDPKTGQIRAMVGSRDFFDTEIDGQFNIATANRQPGSTFKPFAYATALEKGLTPDTVFFDVETQFSTACTEEEQALATSSICYTPGNYDDRFRGPLTMREALAQSINIPAIKALYFAGITDTIKTAKNLGITTLTDANRYGLTLVLGGGEVSLLDMTSAYGVFANDGKRIQYTSVLEVQDKGGAVLETYTKYENQVLDTNIARTITDMLSDNKARTPAYGPNSMLHFPGRDVAVKTGTTSDYKDVWIIGYTPSLVVGAWAGNNSNKPMEKKVAGQVIAPMWNNYMNQILPSLPNESFVPPELSYRTNLNVKPILRGVWNGGTSVVIDSISKKLATQYTPEETKSEVVYGGVHSELFWISKNNPTGPSPENPADDPQFELWEKPVREWVQRNNIPEFDKIIVPTAYDDVHVPEKMPRPSIVGITSKTYSDGDIVSFRVTNTSAYPIQSVEIYNNDLFIKRITSVPFDFAMRAGDIPGINNLNSLRVVVKDSVKNSAQATAVFSANIKSDQ